LFIYQKNSKGPGGACVRQTGAPVPRHNGTMASPSLAPACYHHREIKKYSPGYAMHKDCPPLLVGQKSTSRL